MDHPPPIEFAVDLAGILLRGESIGEQPRVVLVHGMAGDRHTWDSLLTQLPPALALLRYDMRGFGVSGWDAQAPYDHADDLLAVLDDRQIERADLVGVSLGGAVVLNFALRHPQRVRSLVLVSPALVAWEWSEAWRERWQAVKEAARAGDLDEARRRWWAHPLFDTTRDGETGATLRASIFAYACQHWLADPHVHALPDIERLHTLAVPTLLLTGELDLEDMRLIGDVLEASAPGLERLDLPGCGHLLQLENPAACARAMCDFWAGLE